MWLRIDFIEQAIRESGVVPGSIGDAGYRAAYAIAADNLRLGCDVIADSVNGWSVTRNAWRDAGVRAGAQLIEVEQYVQTSRSIGGASKRGIAKCPNSFSPLGKP